MVARVADHRVARIEQRAYGTGVGEVARGVHEHVLAAHPVRQLALELQVDVERPVEEARAGDTGPVLLEGGPRGVLHALVAGQPEVVVGAEHDAPAALHVDHRSGRSLEHPEIRHQVVVASGLELFDSLVAACLFEEIDGGGHVGWRAVSVAVQPVGHVQDRRAFVDLPFRLHGTGTPWVPPLKLERHLFLSPRLNAFFHPRRGTAVPRSPRRPCGGAHQRAHRPALQRPSRQRVGDVRLSRGRGGRRGPAAPCSTPRPAGCASAGATGWSGRWTSR